MKHNFYCDYMYYRVAKFFFKKDGELATRATIFVSSFKLLIIVDFTLLAMRCWLSKAQINQYNTLAKISIGILLLVIIIIDDYQFKNNYRLYEKYWEAENRSIYVAKGILIVISYVLSFLPLLLLGTVFKDYKEAFFHF